VATARDLELPRAWPGFSATGAVVLPIPGHAWAPPAAPLQHAAREFTPKRELHVTLLGKALGGEVRAWAADPARMALLAQACGAQRWRLRRSGWWLHLRKPGEEAAVESIVELVALPAMARFHAALGRLLGCALPVPPPHVTLFVRNDAVGIGVPDVDSLRRYCVAAPFRAPALQFSSTRT
jgi:hypothetical protein